jgi:hypothetical protein
VNKKIAEFENRMKMSTTDGLTPRVSGGGYPAAKKVLFVPKGRGFGFARALEKRTDRLGTKMREAIVSGDFKVVECDILFPD